jgi:L-gulonate 5-dehydrogenase
MGRPNVCLKKVLGVHRDGGFSEYVCARSKCPCGAAGIPDQHAVLIEPFSVAANMTAQLQPATVIVH